MGRAGRGGSGPGRTGQGPRGAPVGPAPRRGSRAATPQPPAALEIHRPPPVRKRSRCRHGPGHGGYVDPAGPFGPAPPGRLGGGRDRFKRRTAGGGGDSCQPAKTLCGPSGVTEVHTELRSQDAARPELRTRAPGRAAAQEARGAQGGGPGALAAARARRGSAKRRAGCKHVQPVELRIPMPAPPPGPEPNPRPVPWTGSGGASGPTKPQDCPGRSSRRCSCLSLLRVRRPRAVIARARAATAGRPAFTPKHSAGVITAGPAGHITVPFFCYSGRAT